VQNHFGAKPQNSKNNREKHERAEPVFEATEDLLKDIGAVKRIGSKKNRHWEVIG